MGSDDVAQTLLKGGVAVIPTDTIYGIVGKALNQKTVERIYKIKKRTPDKPFIILIADYKDLELFSIRLNGYQKKFCRNYWPDPVSIAIACPNKRFEYLHRGTKFLAFRMPNKKGLRCILSKTGPLVAPSANPEGLDPSNNIIMAKEYFGKKIDAYIDEGKVESAPSTLVLLNDDKYLVLREGAVKVRY
jgi:L-threonylcarbamoyladenylate synthase